VADMKTCQTAAAPERRFKRGRSRCHDAPVVRTLTVLRVVLHPKVVPHLVRDSGGHEADYVAVPHVDAPRELVSAHGALQGLAHDAPVKLDAGQQLGVVVGVVLDQALPPVVQEVCERVVAFGGERDLVVIRPHDDANEGDVDVEGRVERVHNVGDVLADAVDALEVAVVIAIFLVVHNQEELHITRAAVRVPWPIDPFLADAALRVCLGCGVGVLSRRGEALLVGDASLEPHFDFVQVVRVFVEVIGFDVVVLGAVKYDAPKNRLSF
jgi:hypothetical protein